MQRETARDRRGRRGFPRRFFKLCALGLCILLGVSLAEVITVRVLNPPFTVWMVWKWLSTRVYRAPDEEAYSMPRLEWRSLRQISPHLLRAVLAAEDQRFPSHYGFDLVELQEALRESFSAGHKVRGASTITMQAARTVFLWPSRTWVRKLAEAYYTVLLEMAWSKKRTLEVYLNTVDWGDETIGAESASRRYFHRSARDLTPSEAAMLAAILPNPHVWSPERPTEYLRERQKKILKDMERMSVSPILR